MNGLRNCMDDQFRHAHAIAGLADELDCSIAEVEPVYTEVLSRLSQRAWVAEYLPVFVSREVRFRLKKPAGLR